MLHTMYFGDMISDHLFSVQKEHVRCLYCEATGARVVHPALEKFHGGGSEFEKMIRGEHSLNNDFLICKNEFAVQRLCSVEEDFMYIDVN